MRSRPAPPRTPDRGRRSSRPAATPIAHSTLVCTGCGASTEVELDVLGVLGSPVVRALGAELQSHVLELRGRCAACQAFARPRGAWGKA